VLAVDALRSAIKDWEHKHLGTEIEVNLTKKNLVKELQKVIYGKIGVDIVSLKLLKYIGIDEKKNVLIELAVQKDDQFLEDLKSEINERMEKFPDIASVKISLV